MLPVRYGLVAPSLGHPIRCCVREMPCMRSVPGGVQAQEMERCMCRALWMARVREGGTSGMRGSVARGGMRGEVKGRVSKERQRHAAGTAQASVSAA